MLTTLLLTVLSGGGDVTPTPDPTPTGEPLTLAEVRKNLRDPPDEDDDLILGLIVAAREFVEAQTGLVLTRRTVTETTRELGRWIDLSSWPIASIEAIRYPLGSTMMPMAVGSWACSFARRPVRLFPVSPGWGVARAFGNLGLPVEIDVIAGYETPDAVPRQIRQAMHLLVAHWYGNRSAVETGGRAAAVSVPLGVDALLTSFRLRLV